MTQAQTTYTSRNPSTVAESHPWAAGMDRRPGERRTAPVDVAVA